MLLTNHQRNPGYTEMKYEVKAGGREKLETLFPPLVHYFLVEAKGIDRDQWKFVDLTQELVLSEMEVTYSSSAGTA